MLTNFLRSFLLLCCMCAAHNISAQSKEMEYTADGKKVKLTGYYKQTNFIKDGPVQVLDESGNLLIKGNYKNDIAQGEWTVFYDNGKPKAVVQYANGNVDGKIMKYYDTGALALEYTMIQNQLDGELTKYQKSGSKSQTKKYKKGKQSEQTYYRANMPRVLDLINHNIDANLLKQSMPFEFICS